MPVIDGVRETWELRWREPPEFACNHGPDFFDCPCQGFAIAESGTLDLVRKRPRHGDERMNLLPRFTDMLQRWTVEPADYEAFLKPNDDALLDSLSERTIATKLAGRKPTHPLVFHDYDHDGRATEFLLAIPLDSACGHDRGMIAVGVGTNGALHVVSSAKAAAPENGVLPDEHPAPILLPEKLWSKLLDLDSFDEITWQCGDHAAEEEETTHVRAHRGAIDVTQTRRPCPK